jgi:hypothetical protein
VRESILFVGATQILQRCCARERHVNRKESAKRRMGESAKPPFPCLAIALSRGDS